MLTTATAFLLMVSGPLPPEPGAGARCVAASAQFLVGRKGDRRTAAQARRASGAGEVRVIGWRDAYTQDLRSGRINLELDRRGRVKRIACF